MGAALLVASSMLMLNAHAEGDREQEQVRRLKMQLRQVQQQQEAAVQEAQSKAEADKAALSQTLKSAQSEAASQRAAAGAASRRMKALSDELEALKQDKAKLSGELVQLKQLLDDTAAKAASQQSQSTQTIASWESRNKQLADANDQCRVNNAALYQLGIDLLAKYEHKGFGEVMAVNEPFLMTARVKLENAKAQYQDKLDAMHLKPVLNTVSP